MTELAGDDANVDSFGSELGGVGVPEYVSMYALFDTSFEGNPLQQHTNIGR